LGYEVVAKRFMLAGSVLINHGGFRAEHVEDAKAVLRCAARNLMVSGETRPDAIRLADPLGLEVMRLPLTSCPPEPQALPSLP
jgi:hypothetical protein